MRAFVFITTLVAFYLVGCSPKVDTQQAGEGSSIDTLPTLRTVSSFTGIDQDNAPFNAGSKRGNVWIASFFFTRCGTVCPALNTVLSGLQREVGSKVSFVYITSDPGYDTPDVLKRYAQEYANETTWRFITMPLDSMIAVASRDLGLIEPTSPDIHSTRCVLIDSTMRVRGFYDSADTADVAKLRRILKGL